MRNPTSGGAEYKAMADQVGVSVSSLCINCLAVLDLLETLIEVRDVQSSVETCAGCGRTGGKTYRFNIGRPRAA